MKTKRILALVLSLTMAVTLFTTFVASAAGGADTWDGTAASDAYTSGLGTELDPYIIDTAEQLAKLALQVRDGNQYADTYFKLNSDLDLAGKEWTPIGQYAYTSFKGIFDGNNKTITNLYISGNYQDMGLFAYIQGNGSVYNLAVSGTVTNEHKYTGGIVGTFSGGKIENCSFSGSVTGFGSVGGIVGRINGSALVNACFTTGTITATGTTNQAYAGGIVGELPSGQKVYNCYSSATVTSGNSSYAGGIAGVAMMKTSQVISCLAVGSPTKIVGFRGAGSDINCFSNTTANATKIKNGEIAYKLSQGYSDGDISVDGSMWKQTIGTDDYPNFTGLTVGYDGTKYYNIVPELTLTLTTSGVTVENLSESAALVVASYNDFKLIDIKTVPVSADGTTTIASTGLILTGANTIKAFLWKDMSSMKPLCESEFVPYSDNTGTFED